MDAVSTIVSVEVAAPRDWFFYWFLSVDLTKIMPRHGLIPGIVGVEDQTGPMHVPGSSRRLRLTDGTTAIEQTTSCEPPREVQYRLYELTNLFRHLVAEAHAEIRFGEIQEDRTRVEWQYTFFGRNLVSILVLKLLIPFQYKGFMQSALDRSKRLVEEEARSLL
jgi:hypothetical protein